MVLMLMVVDLLDLVVLLVTQVDTKVEKVHGKV